MTKNQSKLFDIISDELIGYVNKEEINEVTDKIIHRVESERLIILDVNDIEGVLNNSIDKSKSTH
jgi:hypothetical protein